MKLVLRLEDLDVERAVGGKVLHSPGTQDGLVVLGVRDGGRAVSARARGQRWEAWSAQEADRVLERRRRGQCWGAVSAGRRGQCRGRSQWSVPGGAGQQQGRLCGAGPAALTAAVRSTSLRLLRMKQASPLSILQSTGLSVAWTGPHSFYSCPGLGVEGGRGGPCPDPPFYVELLISGTNHHRGPVL